MSDGVSIEYMQYQSGWRGAWRVVGIDPFSGTPFTLIVPTTASAGNAEELRHHLHAAWLRAICENAAQIKEQA